MMGNIKLIKETLENLKTNLKKSILESFLATNDCDHEQLLNSFPKGCGWKRENFEISHDMLFENPMIRAFKGKTYTKNATENDSDQQKAAIANAKLLLKYILRKKNQNEV